MLFWEEEFAKNVHLAIFQPKQIRALASAALRDPLLKIKAKQAVSCVIWGNIPPLQLAYAVQSAHLATMHLHLDHPCAHLA
jgi:hypothetical protein